MAIEFGKLTSIGQDKPMKEPVQAYDAMAGTYRDTVQGVPVEERLGLRANPRGPEPMPYKGVKSAV